MHLFKMHGVEEYELRDSFVHIQLRTFAEFLIIWQLDCRWPREFVADMDKGCRHRRDQEASSRTDRLGLLLCRGKPGRSRRGLEARDGLGSVHAMEPRGSKDEERVQVCSVTERHELKSIPIANRRLNDLL